MISSVPSLANCGGNLDPSFEDSGCRLIGIIIEAKTWKCFPNSVMGVEDKPERVRVASLLTSSACKHARKQRPCNYKCPTSRLHPEQPVLVNQRRQ